MSLALTVVDQWSDGRRLHGIGKVAASSNYAAGGDVLDLSGFNAQGVPIHVEIHGQDIADAKYSYHDGTKVTDGKMICVVLSTGLEVAAGAYPADIAADDIRVHAIFDNLQ